MGLIINTLKYMEIKGNFYYLLSPGLSNPLKYYNPKLIRLRSPLT